ncbi:hypothetical protein [Tenacibaculum maritimum]|uniref:Lipoprotein n=1 Tax=Tenacibaculum maritimum NCIMB 2154 TaxID=1349785 RepID=A0A2H1EDW0_9FLAO|nr:hypothetical protein [Tenacibaculum maritimum]SFZ85175.1 protein of unknown function [Tenacibaculum maritimum NCIMB 2154]
MKKIIYLITGVFLLGCAKSIDIEYNNPELIETENFLVGVWDGAMDCLACCSRKYRYTLTITKHENSLVEGSLKLSDMPEQEHYAVFKLKMGFTDGILTLKTAGKIEETDSKPGCGKYCTNNTYVLNISEGKKRLDGSWLSSNGCSVNSNSTSINIVKQ